MLLAVITIILIPSLFCSYDMSYAGTQDPLYRLVNPKVGDHFYTTSASERDNAVARDGYTYERVC